MMKIIKILILLLIFDANLKAQEDNEISRYSLKLDSSYLFIDNSNRCWFTMEIEADTLFQIKDNMFYSNEKISQIETGLIDKFTNIEGAWDSPEAEKDILEEHKKWELAYQNKALNKQLQNGEELFVNKNDKPFLIWWFDGPNGKYIKSNGTDFKTSMNINTNKKNGSKINLKVTKSLYMDFIIQGNTYVSLSIPVYETETLENEISKIKTIANSLNVYGTAIDLNILTERIKNKNKYVFQDSWNLIQIDVPQWLNVVKAPDNKVFIGTFPEKDNITNSIGILWMAKRDGFSFQDFVNNVQSQSKNQKENVKNILKNEKIRRDYFTMYDSLFICQNVYIQGEKAYCFITFTATPSTYDLNLSRFNELIDNIKIK